MPTTSALTETLAQALGLPRRLVAETARHLSEDGMIEPDDAPATVEGAVTLLIALMLAADEPERAPDAVRLYRALPLDHIMRGELTADGRFEFFRVDDNDPVVADLAKLGERFGPFLAGLIDGYILAAEMDFEPSEIIVGGGLGTATAAVHLAVLADGADVAGVVRFTLAPLGGGRHPDDAPQARLDVFASVPAGIWGVLREFFAGSAESPRKAVIPRAEAAALPSERQP